MITRVRLGLATCLLGAFAVAQLRLPAGVRLSTVLVADRAGVPVRPDRDQARAWATQELSRPEYNAAKPGLWQRIITWLWDQLNNLQLPNGPHASAGLAVLLILLVIVIVLIVLRAGGWRADSRRREGPDMFSDRELTAAEHRAAADAAAAEQDWSVAVLERFRAIVRELEERAVLNPQPGRTADEAAAEAARWLPGLAEPLRAGALLFDEVRYGDQPAGPDGDAQLRSLDEQVRRTKPVDSGTVGQPQLVAPS